MDTRVINTLYSKPAVELFVKITNLCLTIPPEEGPPNPPFLVVDSDKRMIGQTWGEEPATGGIEVYYSLAEDGETVQLWSPEEQGYDEEPGDSPPLYTFPLSQFEEKMSLWAKGELTK